MPSFIPAPMLLAVGSPRRPGNDHKPQVPSFPEGLQVLPEIAAVQVAIAGPSSRQQRFYTPPEALRGHQVSPLEYSPILPPRRSSRTAVFSPASCNPSPLVLSPSSTSPWASPLIPSKNCCSPHAPLRSPKESPSPTRRSSRLVALQLPIPEEDPEVAECSPDAFAFPAIRCLAEELDVDAQPHRRPRTNSKDLQLRIDVPASPSSHAPSTPTGLITTPSARLTNPSGNRFLLDTPPARPRRAMPGPPNVRREALELEDEINVALAGSSLPELVAALSRRHCCAHSHPVHEAVRRRHVGALRLLLAHGFPADELCSGSGGEKLTPLQVCLGAGADGDTFCNMTIDQQVQLVETLLDFDADPNVYIRRQWGLQGTALHVGCHQVNIWLVQVLLRHKADPNLTDSVGQTALHTACTFANANADGAKIVQLLIAAGANPRALCSRGLTPDAYSLDTDVRAALARHAGWWRGRLLAWVRSRGTSEHVISRLPEDALRVVSRFL